MHSDVMPQMLRQPVKLRIRHVDDLAHSGYVFP